MARILFVQNIWFKLFGTMTLSRCLKDRGHTVQLAMGKPSSLLRHARQFQPDLIAFSCMTMETTWFKKTVALFRHADIRCPIVLGGIHATISPDILNQAPFEFLCIGEGEEALSELADAMENGRDHRSIKNLCYKDSEETEAVQCNPSRPLIQDLDALGFCDRSVYEPYPYFRKEIYDVFMMSRGCPYSCSFCYNHLWRDLYQAPKDLFVRYVSVEHALEEIRLVSSSRGIRRVLLADNLFVYNREWFQNFMTQYTERFSIPFTCTIRAEHTTQETIRLLKQGRCIGVRFAVETGDETLRKEVLRKPITNKKLIELADLLHRHDIPFLTYNMFAIPTETVDQTLQTIRLNQRLSPAFMSNNIFMPYPKYAATEYAIKRGLLKNEDLQHLSEKAYRMDQSLLCQPDVRTVENIHKLSYIMIRHARWTSALLRLAKFPPNPLFKLIYGLSHSLDFMRLTHTSFFRFFWQVLKNYRSIA